MIMHVITDENIEYFRNKGDNFYIVSGEGENGTVEMYTGKLTARAIKTRLTKERCGGDRWARLDVR